MEATKACKFRVYPSEQQKSLIARTFGCVRFVYNFCLAEQMKDEAMWATVEEMVQQGYFPENQYKSKFFNKYESYHTITELKKHYTWLREVDNIALQSGLDGLANGYSRYYKKKGKHPKFKSKRNPVQSYTTKSNKTNAGGTIRFENEGIRLPKLGVVPIARGEKMRPEGSIIRATVSRDGTGAYYISLACTEVVTMPLPKTGKNIGIDLGIKDLCILSDGLKISNPKYAKQSAQKIAKLQKALARKQKGSANYEETKRKLAKAFKHAADQRRDLLQKTTTDLVKNYDVICIESLHVNGMLHNHKLAGSISDASWSELKRELEYKAEWYEKKIVVIGTFFPSSQLCSACGHKEPSVKDLSVREWTCPDCGVHHDRDINAAKNVLNEGLKLLHNS